MSKSNSPISRQEDETSNGPSVLDFLYHDSRRIGSFLAQFEGDGHLQQLTRTKNGSKGKRDSSSHEAKGNIGVAAGTVKGGVETTAEMQEGLARVFDPYWSNARAFLDYLNEAGLLNSDIKSANIGQFVIATGFLSIQDLAMFKEAWKMNAIQRKLRGEVSSGKKVANMTAAEKALEREQRENTDLLLEMLQILPHTVHARMLAGHDDGACLVWCTLNQDYLVVPASDIALTYGPTMAGKWSMVGILSAHPEYLTPELETEGVDDFGVYESNVGQVSKQLAPIIRVVLGRPAAAHAITPLLIFRDVNDE
jgi:hypothetical protein